MQQRLWLIGGTQESAQLAAEIAQTTLPCTITVTTASAKSLYPQADNLRIWVGAVTPNTIVAFIQQETIGAILDASHPFAVTVSQLAIATAQRLGIAYLRYERPGWVDGGDGEAGEAGGDGEAGEDGGENVVETQHVASRDRRAGRDGGDGGVGQNPKSKIQNPKSQNSKSKIQNLKSKIPTPLILDSFDALLAGDYLAGERVLLTVGYRTLGQFQPWQNRAALFARILPSMAALEAALAAGFTPDRLIALRPPISADMEEALWRQWNISLVVTKASGQAGGEDIKRKLAAKLGIQLAIISRPHLLYPQQTSDLAVALAFGHAILEEVDLNDRPFIR
ncbi:MAG: precorrin-6A/cobalt-precorrin-6A reductase [Leptolyngbyaceae cyanobacterium MO_188.B28]|nr:precorrin-6A/cobalt-precorrin-6A reductase [Leptolyngbyaceae cyanobacterium MO_188.B28]